MNDAFQISILYFVKLKIVLSDYMYLFKVKGLHCEELSLDWMGQWEEKPWAAHSVCVKSGSCLDYQMCILYDWWLCETWRCCVNKRCSTPSINSHRQQHVHKFIRYTWCVPDTHTRSALLRAPAASPLLCGKTQGWEINLVQQSIKVLSFPHVFMSLTAREWCASTALGLMLKSALSKFCVGLPQPSILCLASATIRMQCFF